MLVSTMKILTPNSKQNVSLSTPTTIQQQLVQTGEPHCGGGDGGGGGIGVVGTPASREFSSQSSGGGSTETEKTTSNGRDQHQKHSGTNKGKYNNHSNKTQQSQQQQQKYHHNSNNNKNKKQHYNNNNSSSSLSRKKFYQQQQNALQQKIQYHYKQQKQQQYLPISPQESQQQQTQTTKAPTTPTINNITSSNNNNGISVKYQKHSVTQKSECETNTDNALSKISDDCICRGFENSGYDKLSSSTKAQNQQLAYHSTSSNNISTLEIISNSRDSATSEPVVPPSCSCWSNISSFSSHTRSGSLKSNKGGKFSFSANRTNLQDFVAAAFAHKCNCQMHSTVPAATSSHTSISVSKKKTFWKNAHTKGECSGGDTISSCSASPKLSNGREEATDKFVTKNDTCSCRRRLRNIAELPDENNIKTFQKADITPDFPNKGTTVVAKASTVGNTLPCGSNINISGITTPLESSVWQQPSTNSPLTVEASKKVEECKKVVASTAPDKINIDSVPTKEGSASAHVSERGPLTPNAYTLDFLHSVGVQITGSSNHVSLNDPLEGENNGRVSAGTPLPNGNRTAVNSTQRASHSYLGTTNPRQPRTTVGGGNGNNSHHHYQQQHYHHHPSQLTIASFLQKDLLGETNSGQIPSGSESSACSKNYSEQRGNIQQQHYARHRQHARYHSNFFQTPHYQQQPPHSTYSGGYAHSSGRSVGGEFSRMTQNVGNQRPMYNGFLNYHSEASGANNLLEYHRMNQQQNQYNYLQNSKSETQNNTAGKKALHCSSSASSCSSSSSSSNSSYASHPKPQQQQTIQRQQKCASTLNSAIETLPSKFSNQQVSQRQGHHHRSHYHGHNYHSHHNHHGHYHHAHPNTPTTPQHQNYYNLTYVSTEGNAVNSNSSISTTTSRGCSPAAKQSAPIPIATSTRSPKGQENDSGQASMFTSLPQNPNQVNYCRSSNITHSTAPQFHQYQQQKYLNKQLPVPLTLTVSSPSASSTPLVTQQMPMGPHNSICCSQLDEATTAAAAAAAKSGNVTGNEYDSDTTSTHSTAVLNSKQDDKYQSLKSSSTTQQQSSQDFHSQPGTPADVGPSTKHLYSPLDYAYAPSVASHAFLGTKVVSNGVQNQHQHQQMLNQEQQAYKSAPNATGAVLPQIYRNTGVIPLLNLPSQSPNTCGGSASNFLEDDYHQRQQPHHLYLTHHQSSTEHLNVLSLSLATNSNSSNSSSGYWSPSHQCSFLYHQALVTSSTPTCGSSSSSLSPCLTEQGDELKLELGNPYQHIPSGEGPSSCLNDQLIGNRLSSSIGDCSSANSSSSNSSVSGQAGACSFGTSSESNSKNSSMQLLTAQQQRSIAQQQQQTCTSSPTILSYSSDISNTFRLRNDVGRNHQQQVLMTSNNSVTTSGSNSRVPQQAFPQMFSHQQPLPTHPLTNNLLYNNPQTHHIRSPNNASMHDFFIHTPPDRFLARAHLIEAKETPTFLLNSSKWDNLSQDIWKKFVCSQQTEETFKQKMHLWRYLYLFVKNAYPRYGLYLVGSTISGFGSDTSDVDMCLVSRNASSIDPRMEALFNLTILRDCLSKSGEFESFNLIEAKVPILRFRDRAHQLEVDLNFNNCVGIKNTHLLYCYSQLDWRLRPLVLVTKLWAQNHNINNAKNMTISSYSLVLMVIHFLQYAVNPPVLPCLQDMFPDKFPLLRSNDFGYVDMNETLGSYESKNNKTIGELFLNFLEYYSCFDYTQFAISVRTGGLLPINVCRTAKSIKNDPHQWKELCIEEPFDLTNTARSVYDCETFERVKSVFISSWHVLQETLDLNSVFLPTTESSNTLSSPHALGDRLSVTYLEDTAEKIAQAIAKTQISTNTATDYVHSASIAEENGDLRASIMKTRNYWDTQYHKENLYEKSISGASTTTATNSTVLSSCAMPTV